MSEKYHISPTTGRPNRCYAEKKPCPLGGPEDHFPTKEAARAAYEGSMREETVAPAVKKTPAPSAAVEDPQDVTTWKPATVDDKLAELYGARNTLLMRLDSARDHLATEVGRRIYKRSYWQKTRQSEVDEQIANLREMSEDERGFYGNELVKLADDVEKKQAEVDAAGEAMQPYHDEYERRGRWNRAFLVTNGNGHVHKNMNCSTCRPTTQYYWVTEYSDHDESEIVEAAGERACTVCYPSAPVNVLNRPTQLYTPEERDQQKAREERAAAAAQRNADKIAKGLTKDGSEFKIEWTEPSPGTRNGEWRSDWPTRKTERFKTERSALIWAVDQVHNEQIGWGQRDREARKEAMAHIVAAVAEKHGKTEAEVMAEIEKKAAAKTRAYQKEAAKYA